MTRLEPPILLVIMLCGFFPAAGQSWTFVREKEGIFVYTRSDQEGPFKAFRGETDLQADPCTIAAMIGNTKNLSWWGEKVYDIRVLSETPDRNIRYYFAYDAPWPFSDRDLVANVDIREDPVTGIRIVYSTPVNGLVPEKKGWVRVKNYWQRWTIRPGSNGKVHLTLEGYIDPAGNVPAWLYNMIVVDTPLNLMREVRKRTESRK
jgi:hypothetical protein